MKRLIPFVIFFLGLFLAVPAFSQNYLLTLKADDVRAAASTLRNAGFDVAGVNKTLQQIELICENPQAVIRQLPKTIKVQDITASQPFSELGQVSGKDYFDYPQTIKHLKDLATQHSDQVRLLNLNRLLDLPLTEKGQALVALHISSHPGKLEDKPKILFIAQHHARELMTHHAVLDLATDFLNRVKAKDEAALAWLEKYSLWFVPVVNPDGLNHVFSHDRMWRKNRRPNPGGSYGVDLNRNYPFQWGYCGNFSRDPRRSTYLGPSAGSEVEVQVMDALNARLRADYVISFHSSGDEVLHPYRCGDLGNENIYYDIRDRLARHLRFGKRVASSSGEDFEHHFNRFGSISFLLEIGNEFQPSWRTYETKVWPRVKKVLPFMLDEMGKPHLNLQVLDAKTGKKLSNVAILVQELPFFEEEIRKTDEFGRLRMRLSPGNYQITAQAIDYKTENLPAIVNEQSAPQQILLKTL